jgi:hypothetical protein
LGNDDRDLQQAELEAEKELRAKMHRWLGMLAAVLVVVAIGVAIWRLNATLKQSGLGMSLGESLGIGMSSLPWILLVILLGVLFSLGTTRIMMGLDWLARRVLGKPTARGK